MKQKLTIAVATGAALLVSMPAFGGTITFLAGDIVVSVEGNGSSTGTYGDNQAAPLTLFQYTPTGTSSVTAAGTLELPQTTVAGGNYAVSGEYGSSSEGTLQLSGNGQYLTIMGYGINADTFNASPATYSASSTNTALAQSGSLTGQSYTPIARVAATIDANGNVNSTTGLFNIFNGNNPRSVYSADGTSFYVSGQGTSGDATGGVFYTTLGSSAATTITGTDAGSGASQDTRDVQIYNNQLYVSTDSKSGATNRSNIGALGSGTPTSCGGGSSGCPPVQLPGTGTPTGKYTITATNGNGINSSGQQINLSPENYFFANSTTLYIADSGSGKQNSANNTQGDGGLQKWSLVSNSWVLDYTVSAGLNLVANTATKSTDTSGTTGLYGLTGEVVGNQVYLYATNETIADLDPTYLYGVTDTLSATTNPGDTFTQLAAAPADSNFKGVALAPQAPEPATFALVGLGLAGLMAFRRRRA